MTKITTLANGDVQVDQDYFDSTEMTTMTRTFREQGAYVYQVWPNGATEQACEMLSLRGNALRSSGDLEATIRANIDG
jgi:hypothetical protein